MSDFQKKIDIIKNMLLPERFRRMQDVLQNRIGKIYILLEDIYQGHNASAVLRSADAFGFQNVLAIENKNKFKPNSGVSLGADKWLSISRFDTASDAIEWIRKNNLKLIATSTHCKTAISIDELKLEPGMVFAFGTELQGLSQEILSAADKCVYIPMYGFVESLNVSVSAAIIMNKIRNKIDKDFEKFALSNMDRQKILLSWLIKDVKGAESIIKKFST